MGGCQSSSTKMAFDGGAPNKNTSGKEVFGNLQIETYMERMKAAQDNKVKLLLLGAGESGKSTVFKQMRILHGTKRSEEDLRNFGIIVRANIIVSMKKLAIMMRKMGLSADLDQEALAAQNSYKDANDMDPSYMTPREAYDNIIENIVDANVSTRNLREGAQVGEGQPARSRRAKNSAYNDSLLFLEYVDSIRILWNCETMKKVWANRAQAGVNESHKEYLKDLSRIASPEYIPTDQDVLLARIRTTQVTMEKYHIDGIDFEVYDIGGQRSERRKWIDCFDGVDAVIFVAALSGYDETLAEARRTNRMVEALELFRSVCNNRAFANTSIMLFLNKKDLFAEKIMESDINKQIPFSDYCGPPRDFDNGVQYFIEKFKECLMDEENEFNDNFIHVTKATDTTNMRFVLDSTRAIIMHDNLKRSGFLGTD